MVEPGQVPGPVGPPLHVVLNQDLFEREKGRLVYYVVPAHTTCLISVKETAREMKSLFSPVVVLSASFLSCHPLSLSLRIRRNVASVRLEKDRGGGKGECADGLFSHVSSLSVPIPSFRFK